MSIICTKKVDNSKNSCRVCLKPSSSYYEFDTPMDLLSGPTFSDALQDVTKMECFKPEETTSAHLICSICAEELKTAFSFLQKAKNTQKILQRPGLGQGSGGNATQTQHVENVEVKSEIEETNNISDPLNFDRRTHFDEGEAPMVMMESSVGDPSFQMFIEDTSFSIKEEEPECSAGNLSYDNDRNAVVINPPGHFRINDVSMQRNMKLQQQPQQKQPWIIVNRKRPLSSRSEAGPPIATEDVEPKIADIELENLFEIGKLMGSIRSGQTLKDKDRINAGKAVIEKVLEILGFDYKIRKADFEYLSSRMEALFNDPAGVYYLPADNGCPARGILLHLYYSRRSELSKKNIISRRKKARREAIDDNLTAAGNSEYQDVVQLFEECDNKWDQIKQVWEATRETRLAMWQSKTSGLTVAELFESFPFLTDVKSDELIMLDFYNLYPDSMIALNNWKNHRFTNVLNHSRSYRDDFARVLINDIDLSESKEDKMVLTLILIPYCMAHNGRKIPNGDAASKNNIKESFINIFKNQESYTNWTQYIEGNHEYEYAIRFLREKGFVKLATYDMNGYNFEYTNPMDAFVNLFARMMVCNIKFPKLCNHVWQFVQQGVFGIPIERSVMVHTAQKALRSVNL
ncbi:hypothetical protein ACFFRR_002949 [Megaselia abdita]